MNAAPHPPRDDRWLLRSRDLLQAHAEQLDPMRQRRLNQARQAALASVRRAPRRPWLLGVGVAVAASALLVALLLRQTPMPTPSAVTVESPALVAETPLQQVLTLPESDLELLANSEDQALLEDLELIAWLESAEHDG